MKIIIEAINFVPSIYLQAFIMNKTMELNQLRMNIPIIKIRLDMKQKQYLSKISIKSKTINIQIMESSEDIFKAFTKTLSFVQKELKKRKKLEIVFGNEMKLLHSFFLRTNDLYHFSEN